MVNTQRLALKRTENFVAIGRDFIGPFQLLRLIRAGTSTQVWEAIRTGKKKRIALKVLMRDFREDANEIEQLKHEAKVGSLLDHPNVIKIYSYHDDQGFPLVAMELCMSKNMKIELRENYDMLAAKMPKVIRASAEGLKHMHKHDWVHCDVKPDNFLVDEEANVKLIDFSIACTTKKKKGLAKLFGGKPKMARGTRSYMAPEQIRRLPPDQRTDVYGLGCVVFELMAKRTPFSGTSPDDLLNKHLHATPPSLEACSGATKEFSKMVTKMMAKDPEKRFQSMAEFLDAFSRTEIYRPGERPENYSR